MEEQTLQMERAMASIQKAGYKYRIRNSWQTSANRVHYNCTSS